MDGLLPRPRIALRQTIVCARGLLAPPRSARATVLLAVLAACSSGAPQSPADAPVDMRIDAMRSVLCAREGTSTASGAGPDGSLDTSHVYALALTGFCSDELILVVTTEDPLASPYLDRSGVILVAVPAGSFGGTAEWSGTFPATISRPDGASAANGTLYVDRATPGYGSATRLRATVQFNDRDWQFTATLDAPYCNVRTCI